MNVFSLYGRHINKLVVIVNDAYRTFTGEKQPLNLLALKQVPKAHKEASTPAEDRKFRSPPTPRQSRKSFSFLLRVNNYHRWLQVSYTLVFNGSCKSLRPNPFQVFSFLNNVVKNIFTCLQIQLFSVYFDEWFLLTVAKTQIHYHNITVFLYLEVFWAFCVLTLFSKWVANSIYLNKYLFDSHIINQVVVV